LKSAELKKYAEWVWVPAVMWVVTLVLYRTMWWPPPGRPPQWLGWDCFETYWPDLSYYASSVRHGTWPLWNPYDRGGYPFFSDPQPGLYYPINWLFVIPGALAGGMPLWAMELKALLHHVLMGSLLFAYLRTRGLPRFAAVLAGAALILSAPFIIHKASAQLWPMVWAPLVWICIDRMVEKAREPGWWRRSAALAGAIFLSGASGPPPGFFYILLMSLAYGALRLYQVLAAARHEGRARLREEARVQARALAVAGGIAVALLVVVVLPGLTMADESATRGSARNLSYALNTALPVGATLKGLVAPWAGLVDAYWGIAMVVLAIVALVTRPRADRDAPWLFAGVALVALVLAFGGATPVLPWLVKHVPGFGLFREPNRYKIVSAIALAVVAAHGAAALVDEDRARRRRALLALGGAVVALAATMLLLRGVGKPPAPGAPGMGLSLVLLGLGAALLGELAFTPARFRPVLVVGVLAMIGWDTSSFASGFLAAREAPVDDQEDRRFLAGLGDVAREWRVYDEYVMEQRPGARLRIRDFRGYPSGDPFDDLRYAEVRARFKQNPELVAAFNIGWVLHGAHHRNGTSKNFIVQPPDRSAPTRFKKLDEHRFEVVDPAPLCAWYGAAQIVPARAQALDALVAEERASGLRTRAIVEKDDVPGALAEPLAALAAAAETPASIPGRLLDYGENAIRVAVDAPARGVVVLNEKMLPGWQVTVDGQPAPAFRANYLLRAVLVPPGAHTIVWSYHPPRYAFFLALWLAGAASLIAAGVSAWRARRTRPPAAA
jgi:hypothetical protein